VDTKKVRKKDIIVPRPPTTEESRLGNAMSKFWLSAEITVYRIKANHACTE
jgi:hypothetical protein